MSTRPIWNYDCLPSPTFETAGRITFEPDRGAMKTRVKNWVVIEIDRGLTAYYRWHLRKNWWEVDLGGRRRPIYMPSWDAHLSVVRGEQSRRLNAQERSERWAEAHRRFNNQKVRIYYTGCIRQSGDTDTSQPDQFWFVDAYADCVVPIRMILDLPNNDFKTGRAFTSHITIGRTYTS